MTDYQSYPVTVELANRLEELRSLSSENWRVEKEPHSYNDGTTHFNHVRFTAKHFGDDMTVEVASHVSSNLGELLCLLNNNLDEIIGALRTRGVAQAGPDSLLLMQARYVLKNLHVERPGCGYDKLASACEAAALPSTEGKSHG